MEDFVTVLQRRVSPKTIKIYLCGIQYFSVRRGFKEKIADMDNLGYFLKAVRRKLGDTKKRRKRDPILFKHLVQMFEFFEKQFNKHDNTMLRALLTLAFFGMLRCSEYTSVGRKNWDADFDLGFQDVKFAPDQLKVTVFLKASKTDPFRDGCSLRLMSIDSLLCPVKSYFRVHADRAGPLFQFSDGKFVIRADITTILKKCCDKEVTLNTHSFRMGGASAAAAAGIPYFVIQQLGRWKSEAFKSYITLSDRYLGKAYRSLISVKR